MVMVMTMTMLCSRIAGNDRYSFLFTSQALYLALRHMARFPSSK